MRKIRLLLPIAILLLSVSCTKQSPNEVQKKEDDTPSLSEESRTTEFARILAKALNKKEVRELLKQEALKKFDKDYDVLYQLSKDVQADNGKSLQQLIKESAEDSTAFIKMIEELPLVTIFIPELGNFNPRDWNTENEIPIVAVRNASGKKRGEQLITFDSNGNQGTASYTETPKVPVLVVKENERVSYNNNGSVNNGREAENKNAFLRTSGKTFSFVDKCYDGLSPEFDDNTNSRIFFGVDPLASYARQHNISPVRDYIYYGIDPSTGTNSGPLKANYAEFLMGIAVNSVASKSLIVDWTDGMLEFRLTTFFIPNAGAVSSITKNFPADPIRLFPSGGTPGDVSLTSTPLEIANWDMQKYGDTWKLSLIEYDPGAEFTYSTSFSSTFGINFGLDANTGQVVKVGLKFGVSSTTTRSETVTMKITDAADNLGEALLDYSTPLEGDSYVVPGGGVQYKPYTISTGIMTIYITTRKRF